MDKQKLLESLSPNEIKILPHLGYEINKICLKSGLDKTSVLRALEFLEKKDLVKLSHERKTIVELGVNGILYRKKNNYLKQKKDCL